MPSDSRSQPETFLLVHRWRVAEFADASVAQPELPQCAVPQQSLYLSSYAPQQSLYLSSRAPQQSLYLSSRAPQQSLYLLPTRQLPAREVLRAGGPG
jgi:hypothetical protein